MAHRPQRLRGRLALAAAVCVLALGGTGCHRARTTASTQQTYTVEPRPFDVTLALVGAIGPAAKSEVVAPFDGAIRSVAVHIGQAVCRGQPLFDMDAGELTGQLRDAQAAFLKSQGSAAETTDWEAGGEVARARRGLASAQAGLKSLDARLATTRALLDRGLVARDEYQGLVDQRLTAEMALQSAEDDLKAARDKGSPSARRIAQLDLENASAKLDVLQGEFAHAQVVAAADGVLIRTPAGKGEDAAALAPGTRLQRGQVAAEIARSGELAITVKLNEADVDKVRAGMAATVTGPGFPGIVLSGRVISVANEAGETQTEGSGAPGEVAFAATIGLDRLTPAQAAAVRMGMTANVALVTYHADGALTVPPQALQGGGPAATVLVAARRGAKAVTRTVSVGQIAPDGVEITSGLQPGEVVEWSTQTASPPP